jgi:hypothetical protein
MMKRIAAFFSRLPARTIGALILAWIVLAVVNFALKKLGLHENAPTFFPISIFRGPELHILGIPYLAAFCVVLALALRYAVKLNVLTVWLAGIALIVLGNLGQGGWNEAFGKPFSESGIQYYHDAVKITSGIQWLSSFNADQPNLLLHARTHPPFAVLIHYVVIRLLGNSPVLLGLVFMLIASMSVILMWLLFRTLGVPPEKRGPLCLLFAVLPAVNIYSGSSLDGVILTCTLLFLLGMAMILQSERLTISGLVLCAAGAVLTNLLTFGGVFVFAVAGLLAVREFVLRRSLTVGAALFICIGVFLTVTAALDSLYGYSHLRAFLTASAIENPGGFRGFSEPVNYLATRVECVSEIAFFLSFGFLAILFHPARAGFSWTDVRSPATALLITGPFALLAIFLGGAYNTGETARTALFIYPYLMTSLVRADAAVVGDITVLAGIQTVGMQLLGNYFW